MRALQKVGWRTGAFGKVHFRPHYESVNHDSRPYGFDVTTHVTEDDRGGEWLDWVEKEHPEHYENVLSTAWGNVPDFSNYGPGRIDLKSRIEKIRSRAKRATDKFTNNTDWAYTLSFPEEITQTSWITARALDFISETPEERSSFAQISYVSPHPPFCPPEDHCLGCAGANTQPNGDRKPI